MALRSLTMAAGLGLAAVAGCTGSSPPGPAGTGRATSVFEVKVGDCIVPSVEIKAEVASVKVVGCRAPHSQEVVATVKYVDPAPPDVVGSATTKGDAYPGEDSLRRAAAGVCRQKFQAYPGVNSPGSTLFSTYLLPSARSWSRHDRTIVCIVAGIGSGAPGSTERGRS